MCMSQDGGRLMAGGYNSSYHVDPNVKSSDFLWLPMGSDRKFFVVSLQKMVAGGALISATAGRAGFVVSLLLLSQYGAGPRNTSLATLPPAPAGLDLVLIPLLVSKLCPIDLVVF